MLRIASIVLLIVGLSLPEAQAQTTSTRRAAKAPPAETQPAPRKPSFFERLFGRRPKPTPAPATPAPKTTSKPPAKPRKPRSTASAKPTAARSTAARPKPAATDAAETPGPASEKPEAATETPAEKPATKPAVRKTATKSATRPAPPVDPTGSDPEELDRQKYDAAKARAMEDPEVAALKQKADEAVSDDEANKAQRAYNKALYGKMRKLDPLIKERIDRMEAAMMKKLGDQPGAR